MSSRIADFVREAGGALPLALAVCILFALLGVLLTTFGDGLRDAVSLLDMWDSRPGFAAVLSEIPAGGSF